MTSAAAPPVRVPWRLLVALFLGALALRPDVIGIGPLLEPIRADLGTSRAVIGLLPTVPVLCMGLFAPAAARVAARWGPRAVILAGLAGIAFGSTTRAFLPGAASLLAATVVIGIGIAAVQTLLPAVVKARAPGHATLATTVYVVGIQLGAATSAGVSGPLAAGGDWRLPLTVFGAAAALWTVVWWRLGPRDLPGTLVSVATVTGRGPWRDPLVWRLALAFGTQSLAFYGINAWLPAILTERGWTPAAAGGSLSVLNLAALCATISTPALSRLLSSRRRTLLICALITTAGLVLVVQAPIDAWWATLLVGLGIGPLLPLTLSLPLDVADDADVVRQVAGITMGVGYVLAALAPATLGWLRDLTGSFDVVLAVLVLDLAVFAALCATLGPRTLHRGLRTPSPIDQGGH